MKTKIILSIVFVLLFAIVGFLIIQNYTVIVLLRSHVNIENKRLSEAMDNNSQQLTELESIIDRMIVNNNQLRQGLGLSQHDYGRDQAESVGSNQINSDVLFFSAIDRLASHEQMLRDLSKLTAVLAEQQVVNLLTVNSLSVVDADYGEKQIVQRKGGKPLFSVSYSDGRLAFTDILQHNGSSVQQQNRLLADDLAMFIDNRLPVIIEQQKKSAAIEQILRNIAASRALITLAGEKGIYFRFSDSPRLTLTLAVNQGPDMAVISIDQEKTAVAFNDQFYWQEPLLYQAIENFLKDNTGKTFRVLAIEEAERKIEALRSNEAFIAYLTERSLRLAAQTRMSNDYIHYDLLSETGRMTGNLAINIADGEVYLLDRDDILLSSLKSLGLADENPLANDNNNMQQNQLRLPSSIEPVDIMEDDQITTFLLAGAHENNTDSIFLAHCNAGRKTIHLISLPRDLLFHERKINSFYRSFGAERMARELSELSGIRIDRYLIIDMFAFIEVINIIGGVSITLDKPLIDPTYQVRENGRWTTLYYPADSYHLNGVELLRIARSRHTSSDFDRSARQRRILQAMLDGVKDKITSPATLLQLISTCAEYVDTNFMPIEILQLLQRYYGATIQGHGLSSANILYSGYYNLLKLDEEERSAIDDDFNKGAWVLQPLDNDWNNVRWYIRQIINGSI